MKHSLHLRKKENGERFGPGTYDNQGKPLMHENQLGRVQKNCNKPIFLKKAYCLMHFTCAYIHVYMHTHICMCLCVFFYHAPWGSNLLLNAIPAFQVKGLCSSAGIQNWRKADCNVNQKFKHHVTISLSQSRVKV